MGQAGSNAIYDWLAERIAQMRDGDRLPTVRELMRAHGVGQAAVQEAVLRLKHEGLVRAHVGRGSFVVKPDAGTDPGGPDLAAGPDLHSLLFLSNASMNERGTRVQNLIVEDVRRTGGRVVQLTYHDTGHLMELLRSITSFDATILQSHFEVIPLRLLALLQQKTRALVVDGHSITGIDVDHIGIDWQEALAAALDALVAAGHRRMVLVSLDTAAQPVVQARRHAGRIRDWHGVPVSIGCLTLPDLRHPSQPVGGGLVQVLDAIREQGPTAVMFIGLSDAIGIRQALAAAGYSVPGDLSVVMLGHPDVPTEHLGQFPIFGGRASEAAEQLLGAIRRRLARPEGPPEIRYLEVVGILNGGIALPRPTAR